MNLFYREEHATCYNYRLPSTADFVVHTFPVTDTIYDVKVDRFTITFLLSGEAEVNDGGVKNIRHRTGEMMMLRRDGSYYARVLQDCIVVSCAFLHSMSFCSKFSFEKLTGYIAPGYTYEWKPLSICDRIMNFLRQLRDCLDDGLQCGHFHEIKGQELFIYLRTYYSKSDLAEFFYPLLGENMDFKDYVIANWRKINNLPEFASMSNMSLDTFKRRFKATFGMTAKKWMILRKAEMIYRDVLITKKTFSEIANEYNFSSQAYLCNFCKKHYGMTPQEIRISAGKIKLGNKTCDADRRIFHIFCEEER